MKFECISCWEPVEKITVPGYGSRWVHLDRYEECKPRYASPNFNRPVSDK